MGGITLGLHLDGMRMAAALYENGQKRSRRQMALRFDVAGFWEVLDSLIETWPAPERVAVSVFGRIDGGYVQSMSSDVIPFWRTFPLAEELKKRFSVTPVILNNGQATAWAEYKARGEKTRNLLYLRLGHEISAGIILDGRLLTGARGLAGHIGYATLSRAPLGDDGKCGTLDDVASGRALGCQGGALLKRIADGPSLFVLGQKEAKAHSILDNAATAVAEAIANCRLMMDIDEVAIRGSIGRGEGMLEKIRKAQSALPELYRVPLSMALVGTEAALPGVIDWAESQDTSCS